MAENDVILKQRNALGLDVHIKLVDGRELQVASKGKKSKQVYSVDILSLQDKSEKTIFIAWKWLFFGVAFLLLTLFLLKVLPSYLNNNKNLYLGLIMFSGTLGTIFSIVQFWKRTSINQVFYSKKAHVPIIKLRASKPSKKVFSTFINAVEERIEKMSKHMDIAEDKQLIGEMKMLRRLSDDGIISKNDYESAKSKLFSGFDSKIINHSN